MGARAARVTTEAPFPVEPDDLPWEDVLALSPPHRSAVEARAAWIEQARPKQLPPPGEWFIWGLIAGRFFGKSRPASEEAWYRAAKRPNTRIHIIAPTQQDLRRTIFEGESGILARCPASVLRGGSIKTAYNRGFHELHFADGSIILGFSAEQPNRLRGPQAHFAICDELAAWHKSTMQETWDNMLFGLRLPSEDGPRVMVTTTPRPITLIRKIVKDRRAIIVGGSSYENAANIGEAALETVRGYEGTKFGDQEIHGKILDEDEGAIYQRKWFRMWPADREFPVFSYILVSVDGAYTEKQANDPSAWTVWGVFRLSRKANNQPMAVWLPSRPCVMLLDCMQGRLRYPDLVEAIRGALKVSYGGSTKRLPSGMLITSVAGRKPDLALIENKASGISLGQTLQDEDFPIDFYDPQGMDKAMRAHSASPLALRGHVWIPESNERYPKRHELAGQLVRPGQFVSWADPLIDQACSYTGDQASLPDGHDDELDTMTQALLWCRDRGFFMSSEPMGDAGATEASEFQATDPTLWVNTEEGDRGYGVRRVSIKRESSGTGRGAYDGD